MYTPKQIVRYLGKEIKDSIIEYFRPLKEHPKTILGISLLLAVLATAYHVRYETPSLNKESKNSGNLEIMIDNNPSNNH